MNTPFQSNSTTFWDKKVPIVIKEINVNWYNQKRKIQFHFSFKHDVLIFSDVYWQKQISFICDLMVLGGCIPLFYGLTTVSRTKNECNDIPKKLKLSEKIFCIGLECFSNYQMHTRCVIVKAFILTVTEI